jgi:intein/homing endonuclease
MLKKWKLILDELTGKEHSLLVEKMYDPRYDRHYQQYLVRDGSKKSILRLFKLLETDGIHLYSYKVPNIALNDPVLAGAYLAGVIDGDGCIQLRKSYEGNRLERLLKISSKDRPPLESIQSMLRNFKLADGYIVQYANHADLWLFLSAELINWFGKYVKPRLTIDSKRSRLQ